MSFSPVVVGSGLVGWRFLQATKADQLEVFSASASQERAAHYFAENVGLVETAKDLVDDRRLLEVSLTAFGLQDDLANKFFIQRILEDGTLKEDALANRLADDRYTNFTKAFGFGDFAVPRTALSYFPDEILGLYKAQSFEQAVGEQDDTLRLALNTERSIAETVSGDVSNDTLWYRIMGNAPLRAVFEAAFNLPSSFGQLDLEQQLEVFKSSAESRLGTSDLKEIAEAPLRDTLIDTFLLQSQIRESSAASKAAGALAIMENTIAFAKEQKALNGF